MSKSKKEGEGGEMFLYLFSFSEGHVVTRDQREDHKTDNSPLNKIFEIVKIPEISWI